MRFKLVYHDLAEVELKEATEYYGLINPRLGSAFLDEIEHAARLIIEFPHSNPVIREKVPRKLLRKFPYAIFYSVRAEEIRILAVASTKRRPFYWSGRR